MSTTYITELPIEFWKLKGLRESEVWENENENTTDDSICLTDGHNYIWCDKTRRGYTVFTRYGAINDVKKILEFLSSHFLVKVISEHDDNFTELVKKNYSDNENLHKNKLGSD